MNVSACTLSNLKLVMGRQTYVNLEYCNTQVHLLSTVIEVVGKPLPPAVSVCDFNYSELAVRDGDPVKQNTNNGER